MELVLGTQRLIELGDSETYLVTVAEQLQELGHEVTIHAAEQGEAVADARRRGIRVAGAGHELPDGCDAVLVQEGASAYELADRYPQATQVFVMRLDGMASAPPQLGGVTSALVVLSDPAHRRARALAEHPDIVRLSEPVDTRRFVPAGPLHARPRRLLIAGGGLGGERRELLVRACAELGLECREAAAGEPEADVAFADIVVGRGRAVLEAMARGRAAFVLGPGGCDGWVTTERYAALEADGFEGRARARAAQREELVRELAEYRPELGVANRDLVSRHHAAGEHAEQLVELFAGRAHAAPAARDEGARLQEMARLVRTGWTLESSLDELRGRAEDLGAELARCRHNLDNAREIVAAHTEFVRTRRYRLARALGRPADWLRGRR